MKYILAIALLTICTTNINALDENVFVGIKVKQVELVSNKDGRLEVFGVSENGKLYHAWQVELNGKWSFGEALGRNDINKIICNKNKLGQIQVYALCNDGSIKYIRQNKREAIPGYINWSSWNDPLRENEYPYTLPPWGDLDGKPVSDLVALNDKSGNSHLFIIKNGQVHYKTEGQNYWSPQWINLGGAGFNSIKAIANKDGRLELFGLINGKLLHKWQEQSTYNFVSMWYEMPGIDLKEISVEINPDGRITIFSRGGDGVVYTLSQVASNGRWEENWSKLNSGIVTRIKSIKNMSGILGVFAIGLDGQLYHSYKPFPNVNYTEFAPFGSSPADYAIGNNADGRMEIFVIDKGNRFLYNIRQQSLNSSWTGWKKFTDSQILPYDLVAEKFDPNGLPLNPIWGYQKVYGRGMLVNYDRMGPSDNDNELHWYGGDRPCTHIKVNLNEGGPYKCGPHVNFGAVAVQGSVLFKKKQPDNSNESAHDGDFNMSFRPPSQELLTSISSRFIEIEFDGKETANYFTTPVWAYINNNLKQDLESKAVKDFFNNKPAITIAELNFDCAVAHNCGEELHPAYALFVNYDTSHHSNKWIFFLRNNGNQGACSERDILLKKTPDGEIMEEIKILIPSPSSFVFPNNCTNATINFSSNNSKSIRYLNKIHIEDPFKTDFHTTRFVQGKGLELTFKLPKPGPGNENDNVIYGEFTIDWQYKPASEEKKNLKKYNF